MTPRSGLRRSGCVIQLQVHRDCEHSKHANINVQGMTYRRHCVPAAAHADTRPSVHSAEQRHGFVRYQLAAAEAGVKAS